MFKDAVRTIVEIKLIAVKMPLTVRSERLRYIECCGVPSVKMWMLLLW